MHKITIFFFFLLQLGCVSTLGPHSSKTKAQQTCSLVSQGCQKELWINLQGSGQGQLTTDDINAAGQATEETGSVCGDYAVDTSVKANSFGCADVGLISTNSPTKVLIKSGNDATAFCFLRILVEDVTVNPTFYWPLQYDFASVVSQVSLTPKSGTSTTTLINFDSATFGAAFAVQDGQVANDLELYLEPTGVITLGGAQTFTIVFEMYVVDVEQNRNNNVRLVDFNNGFDGSGDPLYQVYIGISNDARDLLEFGYTDSASGTLWRWTTTDGDKLLDRTLYTIVVSFKSTGGVDVWLNGEQVALLRVGTIDSPTSGPPATTRTNQWIGRSLQDTYYTGYISRFRIYQHILNTADAWRLHYKKTRPTAACASSVSLDLTSQLVALPVSSVDRGSTQCGTGSEINTPQITLSANEFGCTRATGHPFEIIATVTDTNGNIDTCVTQLTVTDSSAPTVGCKSPTLTFNANGIVVLDIQTDLLSTSPSDNCATTLIPQSTVASVSCGQSPSTTTISVFDDADNEGTCVSTITVLDVLRPVAHCDDGVKTIQLTSVGDFMNNNIANVDEFGASNDNCGITFSALSPTFFTCANVGINTVTHTIKDEAGNEHSCTREFEVEDKTAPTAECKPNSFTLDNLGAVTFSVSDVESNSLDSCGIASVSSSKTTFSCNEVSAVAGTQTVVVTAIDNNGNLDTCDASVIVVDDIKPNVFCTTGHTVSLDALGEASIGSNGLAYSQFETVGTSDACGYTLSLDSSSWDCSDRSATKPFVLTATDPSSNAQTCFGTVAVVDEINPVLTCQNVTKNVGSSGSISVTVAEGIDTSSDACGFNEDATFQSIAQTDFVCGDIGDFSFTAARADKSGNVGTCEGKVSVVDTTPPSVVCKSTTVLVGEAGNGDKTPDTELLWNRAASSDHCGLASSAPIASPATFACSQHGTELGVSITAFDNHNNEFTCTSQITVVDETPPVAVCNNQTIDVANDGIESISAAVVGAGSSDICGLDDTTPFSLDKDEFGCSDFGEQAVTLTVKDTAGNTATCVAWITVQDTTAPQGTCEDGKIDVGQTGTYNVTEGDLHADFSDECNVAQYSFSTQTSYSCADIGTVVASLLVEDNSGNVGGCERNITVVDDKDPNPNCRANILVLGIAADASDTTTSVDVEDIGPDREDECSIVSTTLWTQDDSGNIDAIGDSIEFGCAHRGLNTVTLEVVDQSQNSDTCHAFVLVDDTTKPVVSCATAVQTLSLGSTGTYAVVGEDVIATASDVCGISDKDVYSPTATFSCSDIGNPPTEVIAWITDNGELTPTSTSFDATGNTATCTASVVVVDGMAPVLTCTDVTVEVGDDNQATVTFDQVKQGMTENCGEDVGARTLDTSEFNCTHIGENPVTIQVTDVNGLTDTCSGLVLVEDSSAPTFACASSQTVTVGETLQPFTTAPTDVCGEPTTTITPTSYNCAERYSTQQYDVMVSDTSANSDHCSVSVYVDDEEAPTASCVNGATLELYGPMTLPASNWNSASTDNCGTQFAASQSVFDCTHVGGLTVTLWVSDFTSNDINTSNGDSEGNVASCTVPVVVTDIAPPVLVCKDTSLDVGGADITLQPSDLVDASQTSDNCGIAGYAGTQTTFGCSDAHPSAPDVTVTVTATDVNGLESTCTSVVMVDDNTKPQITCPTSTVVVADVDNAPLSATVASGGVSTVERCGVASVVSEHADWVCTDAGTTTTEIYKITDDSGNTDTCMVLAIVEDQTKPTLNCKSTTNFGVGFDGSVTIQVQDLLQGATTDGCADHLTHVLSDSVFSCADINASPSVTITANDRTNTDTCSPAVVIKDDQLPETTCVTDVVTIDIAAQTANTFMVVEADFVVSYTDNCGVTSTELIPEVTVTCQNVTDTFSVFFKVLDAEAEPNTLNGCGSDFVVIDGQAPVISFSATTVTVPDAQAASYTFSDNSSCTNCVYFSSLIEDVGCDESVPATFSPTSFTCADRWTSLDLTVTGTDDWGNTATKSAKVYIDDDQLPSIQCLGSTEYTLSTAGNYAITVDELVIASSDNCGISDMELQQSIFTCADRGTLTLVTAVSDFGQIDTADPSMLTIKGGAKGNIANCTTVITITDDTIPDLQCYDGGADRAIKTVEVGATGTAEHTVGDVVFSVEDACDEHFTYDLNDDGPSQLTTISFGCEDIGSVFNTIAVRDSSSNKVTCSVEVIVQDTTGPVITIIEAHPEEDLNLDRINVTGEVTENIYTIVDPCDTDPIVELSPVLTCAERYTPTNVTITATDSHGNANTATVEITAIDTEEPLFNCFTRTVTLSSTPATSAPGEGSLTDGDIGTATDNCAITDTALSQYDFTCTNIGEVVVTYGATDFGDVPTDQDNLLALSTTAIVVSDVSDNGNLVSCAATVTVLDNAAPTLTCDATVAVQQVNAATAAKDSFTTVTLGDIIPTTQLYDNCGIDRGSSVITPSEFSCGDLSDSKLVNIKLFDSTGNSATCNHAISLIDSTPPTVVCKIPVIEVGEELSGGFATVLASDYYSEATDFCGVTSRLIDAVRPPAVDLPQVVYSCADLPSQNGDANLTATITVKDDYDNSDSCITIVELVDSIPPSVTCFSTTKTVELGPSGQYTVANSDVVPDNAAQDTCGILSEELDVDSLSCSDKGLQTVVFTATDWGYSTNSCTRQLFVQDSIAPVPTCRQGDFNVGADQVIRMNYTITNTDNCDVDTIVPEDVVVACFDVGDVRTTTINVFDDSGNSQTCVSVVTIVDSTDPIVRCPATDTVEVGNGPVTVNAGSYGTTYTDICGISTRDPSIDNLNCDDVANGATVTFTVVDLSANTDTCTTDVTVTDTVDPSAQCPNFQEYTVHVTTGGVGVVDAMDIADEFNSTDVCGISNAWVEVTQYSCTDIGTQTITLTVEDPSTNTDSCMGTVSVRDTQAPTCTALSLEPIDIGNHGSETLQVTQLVQREDNCGIASENIIFADSRGTDVITCEDIGTMTVTVSITDTSANVGTCEVELVVHDVTQPDIRCRAEDSYNVGEAKSEDAGLVFVTAQSLLGDDSFDHCGLNNSRAHFTATTHFAGPDNFNTLVFSCADLGSPQLLINGFDVSGNSDLCEVEINIIDTTLPVPRCVDVSVGLDGNGQAIVSPGVVNAGSFDVCGVEISISGPANFNCADLAVRGDTSNSVTLLVTDPGSNMATCTSAVNIIDEIRPVVECVDEVELALNSVGEVSLRHTAFGTDTNTPVALYDNCGTVATTKLSRSEFTCGDVVATALAPIDVTLFAEDESANEGSCTTKVTIVDDEPPRVTKCIQSTIINLNADGNFTLTASDLFQVEDNCRINSVLGSRPAIDFSTFDCDRVGETVTITGVAFDRSELQVQCVSAVTIDDKIKPNAMCKTEGVTVVLEENGEIKVNGAELDDDSSDNCGIRERLIETLNPDPQRRFQRTRTFTCKDAKTPTNAVRHPAQMRVLTNPRGDRNFMQAQCQSYVTVLDNQRPVMKCSRFTANIGATGSVTVSFDNVAGESIDNCQDTVTETLQSDATDALRAQGEANSLRFTCEDVGQRYTVTAKSTDASFNTNTCPDDTPAVITVQDNIKPILSCSKDAQVTINPSTGTATVAAVDLVQQVGTTDNCAIKPEDYFFQNANGALNLNEDGVAVFACRDVVKDDDFNFVARSIAVCVKDRGGHVVCCDQPSTAARLIVKDDIKPDLGGDLKELCKPAFDIELEEDGTATILPEMVTTQPISDVCGIKTNGATINRRRVTCEDVGQPSQRRLTVTDQFENGNSCLFSVNVKDTMKPEIAKCEGLVEIDLDSTGHADLDTEGWAELLGISDNCHDEEDPLDIQVDTTTFACEHTRSDQALLVTVTDKHDNTKICRNQKVRVSDKLKPTIACRVSPSIGLRQLTNNVYTPQPSDIRLRRNDNCGTAALVETINPPQLRCADIGHKPLVTITARDAAGNTASCAATVTVFDDEAPKAQCSGDILNAHTIVLNSAGTVDTYLFDAETLSTDNCQKFTVTAEPPSFGCGDVNQEHSVVITVRDEAGKTDICRRTVFVQDTDKPTFQCKDVPVDIDLQANGEGIVTVDDILLAGSVAVDACSIAESRVTKTSILSCTDRTMTKTAELIVKDRSNTERTCSVDVRAVDRLAPVTSCKTRTQPKPLNNAGVVVFTVTDAEDNIPRDNCGTLAGGDIVRTLQGDDTFGCSALTQSHYIHYSAKDRDGNEATCDVLVRVQDVTAPQLNCPARLIIDLKADGKANLADQVSIDTFGVDNCGIAPEFGVAGRPNKEYSCLDLPKNTGTFSLKDQQFTIRDKSGNPATCDVDVVVRESAPAQVVCPATSLVARLVLGDGGRFTPKPEDFFISVLNDPCDSAIVDTIVESDGGASLPTVLTCSNAGLNEAVNVVIKDALGQTTLCENIRVSVVDLQEAKAECVGEDEYIIEIESSGLAIIQEDEVSLVSSDGCGGGDIEVLILDQDSNSIDEFNCEHIGLNAVTVRVSDTTTVDTCTTSIRVIDPNNVCASAPPVPTPPTGPSFADVCEGCIGVSPFFFGAKNTVAGATFSKHSPQQDEVDAMQLTRARPDAEEDEVFFQSRSGGFYRFWGVFSQQDEEVHEIRFILGKRQKTTRRKFQGSIFGYSHTRLGKAPEAGSRGYEKVAGPPFKLKRSDYTPIVEELGLRNRDPLVYKWRPTQPFQASAIRYQSKDDLLLRGVIVVIKPKVPTFSADLCADTQLKYPIAASLNNKGMDRTKVFDQNSRSSVSLNDGDTLYTRLSEHPTPYCSVTFYTKDSGNSAGYYQLSVADESNQFHVIGGGYAENIPVAWTFNIPFKGSTVALWVASTITTAVSEVEASAHHPDIIEPMDTAVAKCRAITPATAFASTESVTSTSGSASAAIDGSTDTTFSMTVTRHPDAAPLEPVSAVWWSQIAPSPVAICQIQIAGSADGDVELWTYVGENPQDGVAYTYATTVTLKGRNTRIQDLHFMANGIQIRTKSPPRGGSVTLTLDEVTVRAYYGNLVPPCAEFDQRTTLTTPLAWTASSHALGNGPELAFDGSASTVFEAEAGSITSYLTAYITKVDSAFCNSADSRDDMVITFPATSATTTITIHISVLQGGFEAEEVSDNRAGTWVLLTSDQVTLSPSTPVSLAVPNFYGRAIRVAQVGQLRIGSLQNFPIAYSGSNVQTADCVTAAPSTTVQQIRAITDAPNTHTPVANVFDGSRSTGFESADSIKQPSLWFTFPTRAVCSITIVMAKPPNSQSTLHVYVAQNEADTIDDTNGQHYRLISAQLIPEATGNKRKVTFTINVGYKTSGLRLDTNMNKLTIYDIAFETEEGTIGFPNAKAFIQHATPKSRRLLAVESNVSALGENSDEFSNLQTTVHSWSASLLALVGVFTIFGFVWIGLTLTRRQTLEKLDHDSDDDDDHALEQQVGSTEVSGVKDTMVGNVLFNNFNHHTPQSIVGYHQRS